MLTVNTNVSPKDVPKNLKEQLTKVIAASLGKPVGYIAVHINPGQDISFGGTEEPAALCDLVSIGALTKESNRKHSKAIMDVLKSDLKVSPSRTYISFKNMSDADIGFQGTTFNDLM